jgi:hypothetical protein
MRPICAGLAPSLRAKSGSTGTQIEYATMSAKVARVTKATAAALDDRILTSATVNHEVTKDTKDTKNTKNTKKQKEVFVTFVIFVSS